MKKFFDIGATEILPSDRYPYVVIGETRTSYTLWPLICVSTKTGHKPDHYNGPYPVWDHSYTKDELYDLREPDGEALIVRKHKDGNYYSARGIPFSIGVARFCRDYSD